MRGKRIISLLLAICMLAGLLPAVSIAGATSNTEDAGIYIEYDLESRFGAWSNQTVKFTDFTYESNKGLWEFYGNKKGLETIDNSTTYNWSTGVQIQAKSGWWGIKIIVPKSGTYTPYLNYSTYYNYGCDAYIDLYLVPATAELDESTDFVAENLLGSVNCTDASSAKAVQMSGDDAAQLESLHIDAGEYYLVWSHRATGGAWTYIRNFMLDGNGENTILSGITTEPETTIFKDGTADFDTSLWKNDGTTAEGSYTITYKSDDEDVATVSSDGTITGVAPGETVITASVTNEDSFTLTAKKTVTVVTDEIKVLYNLNDDMRELGMHWVSGGAQIPLANLSYDATNGFYKYHSAKTNYVNAENGQPDDNYIRYSGGSTTYGRFQLRGNSWLAIEILVPRAGTYNFETYSHEVSSDTRFDADMSVFVSDEATTDSTKLIGKYNVYNASAGSDVVTKKVGSINFDTAGSYVVTFAPPADAGVYSVIDSFAIVGGENSSLIGGEITADGDSVEVLQSGYVVKATGYLSATAQEAEFTYSSSNEKIATVDAESGAVTAIAPGEVTITATANAKYDNVLTKTITVVPSTNPMYQKSNVKVVYDIASVTSEHSRSKTVPFTYMSWAKSNGFWRYLSNSRNWELTEDWTICMIPTGMQLGNGRWFAFEIYVPAMGTYSLSVQHAEFARSQDTEVYVSSSDEETSVVDTSHLIGKFNSYNAEYTSAFSGMKEEASYIGEVIFPAAGYYRVAFKAVSGDYGTAGNIILDGTVDGEAEKTAIMRPVITSDKDKLVVGETGQLSAVVYNSDATMANSAAITYGTTTPTLAAVDAVTGVVSALAAGRAVFTATATENEASVSSECEIKINPENGSGYIVTYDMASSGLGEGTYANTNDFWQYNSKSDEWLAYNIKVPVSGEYLIQSDSDVYILPSDADIESAIATAVPNGVVDLDAGEYIAVIKDEVADVILDGGEELALMKALLTVENSKATVTGILSDGSETDLAAATVTYTSSDKTVATINAEGVISANSIGSTTITADVTLGVVSKTISANYEVTTAPAEYSGVDVTYDFRLNNGWTSEMSIAAGYTDSKSIYDVRGITYEYTGVGSEPGNWEYRGVGNNNGWNTFNHVSGEFESYDSYLKCRLKSANQYMAFNIKVPAAGKYSPTLEFMRYIDGEATLDLHILPGDTANEDIFNSMTEENCFGTVVFVDKSLKNTVEKNVQTLNNIEFDEAGEYILVFKQPAKATGTYFRPIQLILNGVNCIRDAEVTVSDAELNYGDEADISIQATRLDGTDMQSSEYLVEYDSLYPKIVSVDKSGHIIAKGDGESVITVKITDGVNTVTKTVTVAAVDNTGIKETKLTLVDEIYVRGAEKIDWRVVMMSGNEIKIPLDTVSYSYSVEGIASADSDGRVTGVTAGEVEITLSADFRGTPVSDTVSVKVIPATGKTEPSYYTYERRANAKENIQKYAWAKSDAKSTIAAADKWVDNYEAIYDAVFGEGIPRSIYIGYLNDPEYKNCKFCGKDIKVDYGGWTVNVVKNPWKLQCGNCKRFFPSNDFALLYERGLDEHGYYDRERAIAANAEAVANGEKDALCNELYPELGNVYQGAGLRPGESVETWGVDDGYGYVPLDENGDRFVYSNGVEECHAYIPHYAAEAYSQFTTAVKTLAVAYTYTDDIKYGRAGAIIFDRIADFYPSFDAWIYKKQYPLSCGGSGRGNITGRISDPSTAQYLSVSADAFFPALTDSRVISFLEEKSEQFNLDNSKSSALEIWDNWDKNFFDQVFVCVQDGRINGNYGLYHHALSSAAIVKDSEPETTQMLEWLFEKDDESTNVYTFLEGGDFNSKFIDVVDRDGMGNEASVAYNGMWLGRLHGMADLLSYYKGDKNLNPWDNPKFVNMFIAFTKVVFANYTSLNVGDNSDTAVNSIQCNQSAMLDAFKQVEEYPELRRQIANFLYAYNKYDVSELNYGIYEKDPERIQDEILELTGGEIPHLPSEMMTGYGVAMLRDGHQYTLSTESTATNTLRDFWIWFGRNSGHGHKDVLSLGMEAYGLNVLPDLGYPEITGTDAQRLQWVSATVSHNTVSVDRSNQLDHGIHGYPLHFDDSGNVKVADVSAPNTYSQVDEYRRSIVMVKVDDNISYGVDFFRVIGGDVHTYSLHSQAENAAAVEGLEMEEQKDEAGNWKGSYADPEWEVGEDPNSPEAWTYETVYPRGYSWLGNVRRDETPAQKFAVEFDVEDYRKAVKNGSDIVLRATQINDFTANEVALASGPIPKRTNNKVMPKTFDYMYVQREGEDLDSLFTTLLEPYKASEGRYLKDVNVVDIVIKDGSEDSDDIARAVKVEHTNGRIDWIVYATNNKVTYTVDNEFDFRGFIGVYSKNANGETILRYVNDGDIIGESTEAPSEYKGIVVGHQEELSFENYIDVRFEESFDPSVLNSKYVYIDNDEVENGVYEIESAEDIGNGITRLHTGLTTQIRSHIDPYDMEKGYVYNIKVDQDARVPIAFTDASLPEFDPISDKLSATAGSTITVDINAESPLEGKTITYVGATLPRGANVDEETGTLTWKPSSSQIGENHIAITAIDDDGRESTIHFTITVYGSTTGGTGGGGGATAPSNPTPDTGSDDDDSSTTTPDEGTTTTPEDGSGADAENVRFIDLGNHAWAAASINSLADDGIVKGTTPNTYSPANNITRADFAILLVRAFELKSDNAENFADVADSDYFAEELAIARNTGIVNGIGDNKYAPRNTITRQDMMLIVYRALGKLGIELEAAEIDYSDVAEVSDYAEEAVKALVSAGLVNGKSGKLAPKDYTTRAEVAVLLKRILEYINK